MICQACRINLAIVIGISGLFAGAASALELDGSVSLGADYTNNSKLVESNEESDLILSAILSARLKQEQGYLKSDIQASFDERHYTQDTFGDKGFFNLKGNVDWIAKPDRLTVQVRDFYQQYSINSVASPTQANLQDTNVFSVVPVIRLPLTDRHQLTLQPGFQDYYYQKSNADNQEWSLQADWIYRLYRTLNTGLGGSTSKTDYEDESLNSNYTRDNLYLIVSGRRTRFDYTVHLGRTRITRDNAADLKGSSGSITVNMQLSGRSTLRLRTASELTDANRRQLLSLLDILNGDFNNEQISSDTLRNDTLRVQYSLQGNQLQTQAWVELRSLDYQVDNSLDRDVEELGARFNYALNSYLTAKASASYIKTKLLQSGRTDKQKNLNLGLGYHFSRALSSSVDVTFRNKDSNTPSVGYDEAGMVVRVVYEFD